MGNSNWEKGKNDATAGKKAYVPTRVPYQAKQEYQKGYQSQTKFLNEKKNAGKQ